MLGLLCSPDLGGRFLMALAVLSRATGASGASVGWSEIIGSLSGRDSVLYAEV